MSDAVNSIAGGTTIAAVGQQIRTPAVDSNAPDTAAKQLSKDTANATKVFGRLYDDPLAGVIVTQQLDEQGLITQQTPSISVLAYLRNGLTVQGYPKASTTA